MYIYGALLQLSTFSAPNKFQSVLSIRSCFKDEAFHDVYVTILVTMLNINALALFMYTWELVSIARRLLMLSE